MLSITRTARYKHMKERHFKLKTAEELKGQQQLNTVQEWADMLKRIVEKNQQQQHAGHII